MYPIREMLITDYDQEIELWERTEGMGLSEADSRAAIQSYLVRNVGLSFVCVDDSRVVGTILCGHDGRRGFIYHVAVDSEYRGKLIAKQLITLSLDELTLAGITKCHLMVLEDNELGNTFWEKAGWQRRSGILHLS